MYREKAPAYQRYPKDILANRFIAAMTHEEYGAYDRLCLHLWLEGSLPSDKRELAKILKISPKKFQSLWPAMEKVFKVEGDNIISPELEDQRLKQAEHRAKSAEGGRKSGEVRRKGPSHLVQGPLASGSTLPTASANANANADPPPAPARGDAATNERVGGLNNFASQIKTASKQSSPADLSANAQAARQRTPESRGGAGAVSKLSRELRDEYAEAFGLGGGWMVASESGRFDFAIERWVEKGKPPSIRKTVGRAIADDDLFSDMFSAADFAADAAIPNPVNIDKSKCPDCGGLGWVRLTPEQSGLSCKEQPMARCTHKKLREAAEAANSATHHESPHPTTGDDGSLMGRIAKLD
jgi:uncharacterized protein YdaU (DUF1376 family)